GAHRPARGRVDRGAARLLLPPPSSASGARARVRRAERPEEADGREDGHGHRDGDGDGPLRGAELDQAVGRVWREAIRTMRRNGMVVEAEADIDTDAEEVPLLVGRPSRRPRRLELDLPDLPRHRAAPPPLPQPQTPLKKKRAVAGTADAPWGAVVLPSASPAGETTPRARAHAPAFGCPWGDAKLFGDDDQDDRVDRDGAAAVPELKTPRAAQRAAPVPPPLSPPQAEPAAAWRSAVAGPASASASPARSDCSVVTTGSLAGDDGDAPLPVFQLVTPRSLAPLVLGLVRAAYATGQGSVTDRDVRVRLHVDARWSAVAQFSEAVGKALEVLAEQGKVERHGQGWRPLTPMSNTGSSTKREGSPLPLSGTSTPSKRPRVEANDIDAPAVAAPASAIEGSCAAALQPGASSPAPAAVTEDKDERDRERETDSPSAGRGKRGGRGGNAGARGAKNDRRGRGGGRGGAGNGGGWKGGARRDGDGDQGDKAAEGAEDDDKKGDKLPKRKVAVLLGYNGIGYKGSQINPGMETIEGEVFKAFAKAGAISEDNSSNPQKVSLARAARTDAGVHAALNVLTLKLILSPPSKDPSTPLEEHLNAFLPPAIRVWSVLRVQGSFDPRRLCDQRQYEYTLPTHVLLGPKPSTPMAQALARARAELAAPPHKGALELASETFWAGQAVESTFGDDIVAKKAWRINAGAMAQAREFLAAYEGSHNFYNFTVGKDFRDRSCQRVMRKLELSEPFVVNDTEYVSVTFIGQSFMLHQIRKMIGLFILALRSGSPASLVPETFGPSRIHVPKAPALGLLLVAPHYVEYNRRVAEANAKLGQLVAAGRLTPAAAAEQRREALDPALIPGVEPRVDAFKQEHVYTRMWQVEADHLTFSKWLNYLDAFVGADFG
ncbi:hypothetical protein JCM3770_004324, partial [Rhodotorula araucariae]